MTDQQLLVDHHAKLRAKRDAERLAKLQSAVVWCSACKAFGTITDFATGSLRTCEACKGTRRVQIEVHGHTETGGWHETRMTRLHFFRNGRSLCPSRFIMSSNSNPQSVPDAYAADYVDTCKKCLEARQRELSKAAQS